MQVRTTKGRTTATPSAVIVKSRNLNKPWLLTQHITEHRTLRGVKQDLQETATTAHCDPNFKLQIPAATTTAQWWAHDDDDARLRSCSHSHLLGERRTPFDFYFARTSEVRALILIFVVQPVNIEIQLIDAVRSLNSQPIQRASQPTNAEKKKKR